MDEVRYYPVVSMDTEGVEKQPMFPTDNEKSVKENHAMWLREIVYGCFRLCAKKEPPAEEIAAYRMHCPRCGKVMGQVTLITEICRMPLYICDDCRKTK